MKPLKITCLIVSFFASLTAIGQWATVPSGTTFDLKHIAFSDSLHGYIIAENSPMESVLLETSDGGFTWSPILYNQHFSAIDFLDANTGAVLGRDTIYKTVDGGDNWTMITTNYNGEILFHMIDLHHWIYVRGQHHGYTLDGGYTWTEITHGNSGALPIVATDFQSINDSTFIGVGWYGSRVFKSSDKGFTWSVLASFMNLGLIRSSCFPNPSIGFFTANTGVFKSTDGGVSWQKIDSTLGFDIYCIRYTDANNLYVVGNGGGIAKTSDGGNTWSTDVSGTTLNLNKIILVNGKAIAIGDSGTILMKTNIPIGIENQISTENIITLFPNPTNNELTIQINSAGVFRFELYNTLGEIVLTKTVKDNLNAIDLSVCPKGTYVYKLIAPDKHLIKTGKIIKQ
jgi:photosystem II stability/assembly factor-like uncharacterized protein